MKIVMTVLSSMIIFFTVNAFAKVQGDLNNCARQALNESYKYTSIVNAAAKLNGQNVNLIVDTNSLRVINENQYGIKMSSEHLGPNLYYVRELVLTGRLKLFSCEIVHLEVWELRLITPGTNEWSKVLFRSNQGIQSL